MRVRLPRVDETKLHESYRLEGEARKYRVHAAGMEEAAKRLRREHYEEQYDRCRACRNGTVGEGLTAHQCTQCNSGLLPKGTLSE